MTYSNVKKLDIHIVNQKILWMPNRLVYLYWTKLSILKEAKDTSSIMKKGIILLAKTNPNKRTTTVQVPKQVTLRVSTAPNQENRGTWNVTASIFNEEKWAQN